MISTGQSEFSARRLKTLAQCELSAQERMAEIEKLLELDRAQKLPSSKPQQELILPLFSGCKAHLNLV